MCAAGCAFTTIQAEIDAAASGDTIAIAPGTYPEHLTIPGAGTATQLSLRRSSGNPAGEMIVDGGGTGRVLTVAGGVTVEVFNLTLTHGNAGGTFGGGILNDGTLRLTRVRVTDSQAPGAAAGTGGGISNRGTQVQNNQATGAVGGGGIGNQGSLTGTFVEVSSNRAGGAGGGIINQITGTVTLTNAVVRDNTSSAGGGIAQNSSGALTLTTTAVTGNAAVRGGGLYLFAGTSATLQSSVVTLNAATDTGGGVFAESGVTLNLQTTAIFANTPDNCAGAVSC